MEIQWINSHAFHLLLRQIHHSANLTMPGFCKDLLQKDIPKKKLGFLDKMVPLNNDMVSEKLKSVSAVPMVAFLRYVTRLWSSITRSTKAGCIWQQLCVQPLLPYMAPAPALTGSQLQLCGHIFVRPSWLRGFILGLVWLQKQESYCWVCECGFSCG